MQSDKQCAATIALALSQHLSRNSTDCVSRDSNLRKFCYGCELVRNEMNSPIDVPTHIVRSNVTRDKIQEFLLDE